MMWIFYVLSAAVVAWWMWGELAPRFKREKPEPRKWNDFSEYGPIGETNIDYGRSCDKGPGESPGPM